MLAADSMKKGIREKTKILPEPTKYSSHNAVVGYPALKPGEPAQGDLSEMYDEGIAAASGGKLAASAASMSP